MTRSSRKKKLERRIWNHIVVWFTEIYNWQTKKANYFMINDTVILFEHYMNGMCMVHVSRQLQISHYCPSKLGSLNHYRCYSHLEYHPSHYLCVVYIYISDNYITVYIKIWREEMCEYSLPMQREMIFQLLVSNVLNNGSVSDMFWWP